MFDSPEKITAGQIKFLTDLDSQILELDGISSIPISSDTDCISIDLTGKAFGLFAISLNRNDSIFFSQKIISKALETEFPVSELTEELITNTIGELVNMSLGAYFIDKKQNESTYLSAPTYSNTKSHFGKIKELGHHFRLDTHKHTLYISYCIKGIEDEIIKGISKEKSYAN